MLCKLQPLHISSSMARQISSSLPAAHSLHDYEAKRDSFQCHQHSSLEPTSTTTTTTQSLKNVANSSTELTKISLANLEKLLQKQAPETNQPEPQRLDHKVSNNESSLASNIHKRKNLLEGLNLARFWPQMKAAEEMSPRLLNRLQQLLSMSTQEHSPRNHLGSRWPEYHGSNDWDGLLDPLDENLRREVVRYGEFVQAAYHAFHSNPSMSAKKPPPPQHVQLPDRFYRVTKSLYATSAVGLPWWVDNVAPDLGWMTQRSSWIGYVAVCDDPREIQRMGRRDIVIALRGTATCLEWAENLRAQLIEIPGEHDDLTQIQQPKVVCGFMSLYKTSGALVPSLAEYVVQEVKRLIELYKGETLSITVTGHSLGAALALLVAHELSTCAPLVPPIAVFSFGGPRVGNKGFANQINAKNVNVLRIVNKQDVITRVPGIPMVEELNHNMPWAYSHVGSELRVDTKMSPFLKADAGVACRHDLEAYLHLVDGFLASNCPFRPNAKRSLVKLFNEQGSNV